MDGIKVTGTVTIPESELSLKFSRSGGPGGQNVNTRDTKVEVIFDVAGSPSLGPRQRERALRNLDGKLDSDGKLHVVSSESRTQAANREAALARLKTMMGEALRPDPAPRRATRPSRASQERRLADKKARGQLKRLRSAAPED
ncbi:MAG TPA: alternative ribosome rescue aminoacyl-tRNA hydrolase ArfB [Actinomycetota bacterium]|nr:alternative ribosome rescue aminoacyl-tRNA hydrolase ArfB [Actinomycetota bacterium]